MSVEVTVKSLVDALIEAPNNQLIKWVCDFQQYSALTKALRHVRPTKVILTLDSNYFEAKAAYEANPGDHRLRFKYEGACTFVINALSKNGQPLKREIGFFGSHGGDRGLHVFDSKEECVEKYNALILDRIKDFKREREATINHLDTAIESLKDSFIDSDYLTESLSK